MKKYGRLKVLSSNTINQKPMDLKVSNYILNLSKLPIKPILLSTSFKLMGFCIIKNRKNLIEYPK